MGIVNIASVLRHSLCFLFILGKIFFVSKSVVPTEGFHYIFELVPKNKDLLFNTENLLKIFREALESVNATIVSISYKEFGPGASGVFLLAESHLSFHTWPEENYVSVDFYICGNKANHKKFLVEITKNFDIHDIRIFRRGVKTFSIFRIVEEKN